MKTLGIRAEQICYYDQTVEVSDEIFEMLTKATDKELLDMQNTLLSSMLADGYGDFENVYWEKI